MDVRLCKEHHYHYINHKCANSYWLVTMNETSFYQQLTVDKATALLRVSAVLRHVLPTDDENQGWSSSSQHQQYCHPPHEINPYCVTLHKPGCKSTRSNGSAECWSQQMRVSGDGTALRKVWIFSFVPPVDTFPDSIQETARTSSFILNNRHVNH